MRETTCTDLSTFDTVHDYDDDDDDDDDYMARVSLIPKPI
jgi:hypothetical protein